MCVCVITRKKTNCCVLISVFVTELVLFHHIFTIWAKQTLAQTEATIHLASPCKLTRCHKTQQTAAFGPRKVKLPKSLAEFERTEGHLQSNTISVSQDKNVAT